MELIGSKTKIYLILILAIVLSGCGTTPQPVVSLNTNAFNNPDTKVGILYSPPTEKATTHIFGAGCLLCYGVASALTSSLDRHLEASVSEAELEDIKELIKTEYAQRTNNIEFVSIPTPLEKLPKFKGELGYAKKDFRSLKKSLNVDVLVILEVTRHGAYRSFSNYIPNGDPMGHVAGVLYTVDLETNAYLQYLELNEMVQPPGEWDEPPTFPNVTTSYYQAVENTKKKISDAI